MAAHSPGPWRVQYGSAKYNRITGVEHDDTVAKVPVLGGPTGDANAELIAAAPDLLDACLQLINETDAGDQMEVGGAVIAARAAIAKVRGWS